MVKEVIEKKPGRVDLENSSGSETKSSDMLLANSSDVTSWSSDNSVT